MRGGARFRSRVKKERRVPVLGGNMKLILLFYSIFVVVAFFNTISDFGNVAVTPRQIYECNNLNMFACVLLFIIAFIVNPLFYVAHFLYWIFHVGRKD